MSGKIGKLTSESTLSDLEVYCQQVEEKIYLALQDSIGNIEVPHGFSILIDIDLISTSSFVDEAQTFIFDRPEIIISREEIG